VQHIVVLNDAKMTISQIMLYLQQTYNM